MNRSRVLVIGTIKGARERLFCHALAAHKSIDAEFGCDHTATPWRVGHSGAVVAFVPVVGMPGSDATEYYGGHMICESVTRPNARRIVAAVNACDGISTDYLERFGGTSFNHFKQVKHEREEALHQRDVLLETLAQAEHQRDVAWRELSEIRVATKANSEESTTDEVRRVVAEHAALIKALADLTEVSKLTCGIGVFDGPVRISIPEGANGPLPKAIQLLKKHGVEA